LILRLSNRQLFTYGLVILLTGILIGSVSLTYPFGRDQAFYAYAGKLLLEGKMNYLHVFDLKPPGSHLFFAFTQVLFGESMFNARVFDMLWQSATAFVIFLISFKLTSKKFLSYISAFIYLLLYYRQDYWHTLQADGMLNLPIAICVLLLISSYDAHSFIKIFFAGILFSCALLFKYTVISFLPLVIICFLLSEKELKSIKFKNITAFLFGLIMLAGIVALWYSFTGALKDMADIQFGQTSQYTKIAYETESGEFIFKHIFRLFTYSVYSPLIWFSFAGFIVLLMKRKLRFPYLLILAWIISSLFSLIIQWKFYHYHFLVIIAALSVGAVIFASVLLDYVKENRRKTFAIVFAVILAGFTLYAAKPYIESYGTLTSFLTGKQTLKEVYIKNGFTSDSVFMVSKTFNAVDYVNQNTNITDKVFVWGYDPLVYYLTGRECVSRFVYHIPLLWKAENTGFRKEFIAEMNKANPKLIIIASNDPLYYISGYNEDSKQLLERFPEFKNYIDTKYTFKKRIGDYDFYELKNW
jgi:hypothetical protein